MFEYQKGKTSIDVHVKGVLKIFESMNTPRISLPEVPIERAKAFVVSGKNLKGYYVQIYLLLIDSNIAGIYSPLRMEEIHKKNLFHYQEKALNFAESMGFMMDDLNYSEMSELQKQQSQADLPIFYKTPPPPSPFITTAMPVLNSQISKMNFSPNAHQELKASSFNQKIHEIQNQQQEMSNQDYLDLMQSQKIQTLPIMTEQWLQNNPKETQSKKSKMRSEEKEALVRFLSYF